MIDASTAERVPVPSSKASARAPKIRYGIVGLGHIAQAAVLPAFANAQRNSQLAALVSDDASKLRELSEKYEIQHTFTDLEDCLRSGQIDALYIASPNHQHCEFTVRAAEAGVHVLCEKPMATTKAECEKMLHAADSSGVRLMIAYRLHFEPANLRAMQIARSGQLGALRFFSSSFSMQVREGNIRTQRSTGGGTLFDIGVYCINAARYLFGSEPIEAFAFSANSGDGRFSEIDETTSALLRFPEEQLAAFTCSFGAADCGHFELVGTKGRLRVDPSYEYSAALVHYLTLDGKTSRKSFPKRDQFAPELLHFSDCIRRGARPEPDGQEGLNDVQIVEALYESARTSRPVPLNLSATGKQPAADQEHDEPAVGETELVGAEAPSV